MVKDTDFKNRFVEDLDRISDERLRGKSQSKIDYILTNGLARDIIWEDIEFSGFAFKPPRDKIEGLEMGEGELKFSYKNLNYRLQVEKMFLLSDGWYFTELGSFRFDNDANQAIVQGYLTSLENLELDAAYNQLAEEQRNKKSLEAYKTEFIPLLINGYRLINRRYHRFNITRAVDQQKRQEFKISTLILYGWKPEVSQDVLRGIQSEAKEMGIDVSTPEGVKEYFLMIVAMGMESPPLKQSEFSLFLGTDGISAGWK